MNQACHNENIDLKGFNIKSVQEPDVNEVFNNFFFFDYLLFELIKCCLNCKLLIADESILFSNIEEVY